MRERAARGWRMAGCATALLAAACAAPGAAEPGGVEAPPASARTASSPWRLPSASSVIDGGDASALPRAPRAGSLEPEPPPGVDLTVPELPREPEFSSAPAGEWWRDPEPCAGGGTIRHEVVDPNLRAPRLFDFVLQCQRGGQRDGRVAMFWSDGAHAGNGWVHEGKAHGAERLMFRDGSLQRLRHQLDGVLTGPFQLNHPNGMVSSAGTYREGQTHGRWTEGNELGLVTSGYYAKGQREGRWIGELEGSVTVYVGYSHGALHGDAWLWRGRAPLAVGSFARGEGRWRAFHPDGSRGLDVVCSQGKVATAQWVRRDGSRDGEYDLLVDDSLPPFLAARQLGSARLDDLCEGGALALASSAFWPLEAPPP